MTQPPTPPRAAERLILAKAEHDLDEGLAHLRERLRAEASGPLAFIARGVETAIMGGLAALELRPRLREDVTFLMGLAKEVHAGADPAHVAGQHVERVLRLKELGLVAKTRDPRFAPIVDRCRHEMAVRLPDLARMVMVEDPKDYDDLLRQAFPGADAAHRIVDDNHALMMWIFTYAEEHPDLLRLPKSLVPRLTRLGREVTDWQTARVRKGIDQVWPPEPLDEASVA